MLNNRLGTPCPDHLEDEAFIIETSGEMPEVALAESLLHLGQLGPEDTDCLRAAAGRGYLRLLRRDLDPASVGQAHFRGLERARENLARLMGFLRRMGWEMDANALAELAQGLKAYLEAEERALVGGRGYATCTPQQVQDLAQALGLPLIPWQGLLGRLAALECPDFRALAALGKLGATGARVKRRWEEQGTLVMETLDGPSGQTLARATLPLLGPSESEDPANRRRAELVWSLLDLPPA